MIRDQASLCDMKSEFLVYDTRCIKTSQPSLKRLLPNQKRRSGYFGQQPVCVVEVPQTDIVQRHLSAQLFRRLALFCKNFK